MNLKKENISQSSLQDALSTFPLVPTWGIVSFGKNGVCENDEYAKQAYKNASKNISLEPYLSGFVLDKLSAIPRIGISYTGKKYWASPVVEDLQGFRFLRESEVDYSKLPSLEEFLKNPHFICVEFSFAKPSEFDEADFGKNQQKSLNGLFSQIRESGFHLDNGYLYYEESRALYCSVNYNANAKGGNIDCYMRDNLDSFERSISPENKNKLVKWFDAIA